MVNIHRWIMNFLKNNRFLVLLIMLVSLFSVTSFIGNPFVAGLYGTINYTLMLLSGLYAFSQVRNFLKFTTIFFLFAIVIDWIEYINPLSQLIDTIRPLITALVLILLLIMTLRSILLAGSITKNVIFGSLCGYILIGYFGAFLTMAIAVIYPGSYNVSGEIQTLDAIYYSFITMTTLGYGDLLPLTEQSRALAILLSILGPMYVAILIAMLVGKYSSQPQKQINQ
jgi:voltage-gated potassium channel